MSNCTVSGNSISVAVNNLGGGSGLLNRGGLTMTNCTVSGNSIAVAAGGYGRGGGLYNTYKGALTMSNCTVSGNSISTAIGGRGNADGLFASGPATLTNTIVAGSTTAGGTDIYAAELSGTNNLIGTGTAGGLTNGVNGNLVGVSNPLLAPLGNYGGPTETVALLPGSPALHAGTPTGAPSADQRGEPLDSPPDIGAFQSQGFTLTPVAGSTPQTAQIGTAFANPLDVSVTANNPVEPVNGGVVSFAAQRTGNGATAAGLASSAVIASGQAAVSAAPNNADGSYQVVASANGAAAPVTFTLTNTGRVFAHLSVNSTSALDFPGVGLLSLPEAVLFADADSSGNAKITFAKSVFQTPQTITLTGTQLELSNTTEPENHHRPQRGRDR
jgi:hypothetical protein